MSDDDIPKLCDGDHICSDSDDDEDKWEEIKDENANEDNESTNCLFCNEIFNSIDLAIEHLKLEHRFDLAEIKSKFNMDEYSYIKLINYIRTVKPQPETILNLKNSDNWNDEKYLKPVIHEPWLMFDFEELQAIELDNNETVTISKKELNTLQKTIEFLQKKVNAKNNVIKKTLYDLNKVRNHFQEYVTEQVNINEKPSVDKLKKGANNELLSFDDGYFSTYAHYGIHHEMLSDEVRTKSYRDAILMNSELIKEKIVLDLGCGTSILSLFASKAGAKQVIAVDNSDIVYHAVDIVKKNNIKNINIIKGRLEDVILPEDKVDIIISEWMGYFLLFEGMLDSVIYARDKYLKPDGLLLPNQCNITIAGYGDYKRYNEFIEFWDNVYGYDMTCLKTDVLKEASVEECKPEYILTDTNIIANFDLMTVTTSCYDFSYKFNLNVMKNGKLTSIIGYFDTFFNLKNNIILTTSPYNKLTHWKQVIFYFQKTFNINIGDHITGEFQCKRNKQDLRSLIITIKIFNETFIYYIN